MTNQEAIYCLNRLRDNIAILFPPDNAFRQHMERDIRDWLLDLAPEEDE